MIMPAGEDRVLVRLPPVEDGTFRLGSRRENMCAMPLGAAQAAHRDRLAPRARAALGAAPHVRSVPVRSRGLDWIDRSSRHGPSSILRPRRRGRRDLSTAVEIGGRRPEGAAGSPATHDTTHSSRRHPTHSFQSVATDHHPACRQFAFDRDSSRVGPRLEHEFSTSPSAPSAPSGGG